MLIDGEAPRVIKKALSRCHKISRVYLKKFRAWVLKNCEISIFRCLERWLGNLLLTLNLMLCGFTRRVIFLIVVSWRQI